MPELSSELLACMCLSRGPGLGMKEERPSKTPRSLNVDCAGHWDSFPNILPLTDGSVSLLLGPPIPALSEGPGPDQGPRYIRVL